MKKTLLLLRHAKSSWSSPDLLDRYRPLNARGRKAATRMGRLLNEESLVPDLVLCSIARRTQETADLVFAQVPAVPPISLRDDLYHADPLRIGTVVSAVAEPVQSVLVIGHNPGLEEFLTQFTGELHPIPTGTLAWIEFELDTWSRFGKVTRGTLKRIWRPRELDTD